MKGKRPGEQKQSGLYNNVFFAAASAKNTALLPLLVH